jgi:hypothetical protein
MYLEKFNFTNKLEEISYNEGEPLKLNERFNFFHNKNKFRKELNKLQYIFKNYTGNSLVASGIRDTYIQEEYSENYLLILFTTNEIVKNTNNILKTYLKKNIEPSCFFMISTSDFLLLIAKDMEGLVFGVDLMEDLFNQVFEHYMKQKEFGQYIKIRPFSAIGCNKSK